MLIISLKPGHDGAIAAIRDGQLLFSYEAEKDSHPRFDQLNVDTLLRAFEQIDSLPDVICHSGWMKGFHSDDLSQGAGYFGWDKEAVQSRRSKMFGKTVTLFSSSHERSHIWATYGLSPFAQGQPVHVLTYEGNIGRFYSIDERLNVTAHPAVISDPGSRYAFVFALADPSQPPQGGRFRLDTAGKLMALAAFGNPGPPNPEESEVIDWVLGVNGIATQHDKSELSHTRFYNAGVESQIFKDLARKISDALIARFMQYAERFRDDRRPLLISGGCGLNCDWNRKWADSGIFDQVFVPPVTNDTGAAIGTAVDAQRAETGSAKISWSVYSGPHPRALTTDRVSWQPVDVDAVAQDLNHGRVVAVMRGRCEIGPRALGARSLLAAPFDVEMANRLNFMKRRESYRPIAPVVLEACADQYFDLQHASPHMLYFARVLDPRLRAVTHIDGSARPQTVNREQNAFLADLLGAFERYSGVPVLCNTSLNFSNRGFINSERDLIDYCLKVGVDSVVCGDNYVRLR